MTVSELRLMLDDCDDSDLVVIDKNPISKRGGVNRHKLVPAQDYVNQTTVTASDGETHHCAVLTVSYWP
jgi:hypothetical protein